ncbi:MAG: hypothetical protein KatS3mg115_1719 [Candidatus Poribacteria bacterium]|nr:MAG: hypothetical protein KatS3mg115_1719 [Candidatus Poribacteria bacterium]
MVNIIDLVLVAGDFGRSQAAVALRLPRPDDRERLLEWIREAVRYDDGSPRYRQGLETLVRLVTSFSSPSATALLPNYPEPFNLETWIPFRLGEAAPVVVEVYDLTGRFRAGSYRAFGRMLLLK